LRMDAPIFQPELSPGRWAGWARHNSPMNIEGRTTTSEFYYCKVRNSNIGDFLLIEPDLTALFVLVR
jgi:hypothetical protein